MRYTSLIIVFLATLVGCRSADSHFRKALEKGLKIDTVWRLKMDTVTTPGIRDTIMAEVDTSAILALCKELVSPPPAGKKPRKPVIPRLQEELCPDIDTTYQAPIYYRDSIVAYKSLHIIAKGGQILVEDPSFLIPVVSKEGTTTIRPGITRLRAAAIGGICGLLGLFIGAMAWAYYSNKHYRR